MPPGTKVKDYELVPKLPSALQFVLVSLFWITAIVLSKMDITILYDIVEKESIRNATIALLAINLGLAIAVCGVCIYAELSLEIVSTWTMATAFYGFLTAGPIFKYSFKRRFYLDQEIG